uniref:Uncharacterized protein n=1 Tax=Glossina pallidipes TaxID=7398 RepID=A0A1A9ZZ04_GLOPL
MIRPITVSLLTQTPNVLAETNIWPNRSARKSLQALLDIICVSDSSLVLHYDQFPMGGLLDHNMSSVAYNIELIGDLSVSFNYRAVYAVNLPELAQLSSKIFCSNAQHLADVYNLPDIGIRKKQSERSVSPGTLNEHFVASSNLIALLLTGISVLWLAMHATHDHDDDTSGRLVSMLSCCRCFETYIEPEAGKNSRSVSLLALLLLKPWHPEQGSPNLTGNE